MIPDSESRPKSKYVYFKDCAIELGCTNVEELGDLAVWEYIIAHQSSKIANR